jgi:hypothetical protein
LFLWVGCEGVCNSGLAEAVVGEGAVHLSEGASELGGCVASAGVEPACTLELRVDGGALGSVDGDGADEGARVAAKGDGDAVVEGGCVGLDGVVEAGSKELTEAAAYRIFVEGRAFRLREMAGKRSEAIGRYTFECDAANEQTMPASER